MSKLGFSGGIAKRFQATQITPLLALVGMLLGVFAVMVTPREEEPQINVTFANVFIPFPGASAKEVESLIASPAEQVLDEIDGIEHVYSTSMPGMAVLTVQYLVGEDRTDAIVRLYSKIMSNQDWLPAGAGVREAVLMIALEPSIGRAGALSVAVLSRFVIIAAELGVAAVVGVPHAIRAVKRGDSDDELL